MYICTARCPELDLEDSKHCTIDDPVEMYERYVNGCPCGNEPTWERLSESSEKSTVERE